MDQGLGIRAPTARSISFRNRGRHRADRLNGTGKRRRGSAGLGRGCAAGEWPISGRSATDDRHALSGGGP
jgi:hypothetical protein